MDKILISYCLLGRPTRYDAGHCKLDHPLLHQWQQEGRLVPICPEIEGGLPTPRAPAEIIRQHQTTTVITQQGTDVTHAFKQGAQRTLVLCQQQGIRFALLKSRSPSCGVHTTYDGTFSGQLTSRSGITAELLKNNDILCFDETELEALVEALTDAEHNV